MKQLQTKTRNKMDISSILENVYLLPRNVMIFLFHSVWSDPHRNGWYEGQGWVEHQWRGILSWGSRVLGIPQNMLWPVVKDGKWSSSWWGVSVVSHQLPWVHTDCDAAFIGSGVFLTGGWLSARCLANLYWAIGILHHIGWKKRKF